MWGEKRRGQLSRWFSRLLLFSRCALRVSSVGDPEIDFVLLWGLNLRGLESLGLGVSLISPSESSEVCKMNGVLMNFLRS